MSLVGYYCLESNSWEKVNSLEQKLRDHFLFYEAENTYMTCSEERLGAILNGEEPEEEEDQELMDQLLYGSENFKILYCNSKKTSGWKLELTKNFCKIVPKKIETNLVFEADRKHHFLLDSYLKEQGFKLKQAPIYNPDAIYMFSTTHNKSVKVIDDYRNLMVVGIRRDFPRLDFGLDYVMDIDRYYCRGLIIGDCEKVLYARDTLQVGLGGIKIDEESINFKRKK